MKNSFEEKNIHRVFELSLIIKAVIAFFEIVGGIMVFFISQDFLLNVVSAITQDELAEDARDLVANYLLQSVQHFSISAQYFAALFLLSHGIVKMFLIIGLMRQKFWYYPAAIIVFGLFIVYQLYRFSYNHSLWLLLITVLDVGVIWLTYHEYNYLKSRRTVQA